MRMMGLVFFIGSCSSPFENQEKVTAPNSDTLVFDKTGVMAEQAEENPYVWGVAESVTKKDIFPNAKSNCNLIS